MSQRAARSGIGVRILLAVLAVLAASSTGACSFVFGDVKYSNSDSSFGLDAGDAGDAGDTADVGDGATGCLAAPELCTDGTRCAPDGRCVPCDADLDGAFAPDGSCDAVAGAAPRDCDDDDSAIYPGASPVCGDGKINGCDAGPLSFREALSVAEIGELGTERISPGDALEDLSSLAFDVTAPEGATAPRALLAWVAAGGEARLFTIDAEDLSEIFSTTFAPDGDVLAIDVRRVAPTEAYLSYLTRTTSGDAVLSRGRYEASLPPAAFRTDDYAFDDGPCVTAADAADIAGDLAVDGAAGTTWLLGSSDRAVHATEAGAFVCIAIAGAHRSVGTDGPVVGLLETMGGVRRTLRGAAGAVDDLDAVSPGSARYERPGYAFLRAAAADLYSSASVAADGRTRVVPFACTAGVGCVADGAAEVVFDSAPDVATTYGSALDGLIGDFAALLQIEERASAPPPDDRGHDIVLRILEHPNVAIGSVGAPAPGEAMLLHRHTFDSADRDHSEIREVDVATLRDPVTGDLTVYWAALIGDRRLAPGTPEDPSADNEARYGGVRFCVSE